MFLRLGPDSHHPPVSSSTLSWLFKLDLRTALLAIDELREDADAEALVALLYEEPVASCSELRLEAATAAIQVLGQYGQWPEVVELLDEEAVVADRRLQREATRAAIEELRAAGDPDLLERLAARVKSRRTRRRIETTAQHLREAVGTT